MDEDRIHSIVEGIGWVMFIIIVLLLVTSCGVCHRCETLPDTRDTTIVRDTIYRDSITFIPLVDTLVVNTIPDTDTSSLETDVARSVAYCREGMIHHTLENKEFARYTLQVPDYITTKEVTLTRTIIKEVEREFTWLERAKMKIGEVAFFAIIALAFFGMIRIFVRRSV